MPPTSRAQLTFLRGGWETLASEQPPFPSAAGSGGPPGRQNPTQPAKGRGHLPPRPLGIGVATARRHRLDGDKLSPPQDDGKRTYQQWWETERPSLSLHISTTVLKEVRRGDPAYATAREIRLAGIPLLGDLPEAIELAKRLLRDEIIPAVAADDATHVALAAAHQLQFLLTWNCKPINNHHLRARIELL